MGHMKSVAIIGTAGIPAAYGGFETLAENLTKKLSNKLNFTVFCSSKIYDTKIKNHNNSKLRYIRLNPNGIQSILYDAISIFKSIDKDVLLILGVSGCMTLPLIKILKRRPKIITNIDGLEWKREKWGKYAKIFLKISERFACKYSDTIIADNKKIQNYVLQEYNKKATLIEYGGDHASSVSPELTNYEKPYAFSVCRIEPENNIDIMLKAFSKTNHKLMVVGNWENSKYGRGLLLKYKSKKNISLLPPIYDEKRLNALRSNCSIYLHGHSAGGTNPSLVEAMWLGLPVLAFDVSYNRYTTNNQALYFKNHQDLKKLLQGTSETSFDKIARAMKATAKKRYRWDLIADKYLSIFED